MTTALFQTPGTFGFCDGRQTASAYVLFNQRGHQRLALRSIAARTGRLRDIVDETSDTFIDYSQKQ